MTELPAEMQLRLRKSGRPFRRLSVIASVRLEHNLTVLNDANRLEFWLRCIARLHPNSKLGKLIRDALWNDPDTFGEALTSIATIDRDNRDIENVCGLFSKEKTKAEVQATL